MNRTVTKMKGGGLSAKDAALSYLGYKDRTTHEVRTYLKSKGYSIEEIRDTLEFLLDCDILNDAGYCQRYVSEALLQRKSARRISDFLQKRGISKELIKHELEENLSSDLTWTNALEEARAYMQKRSLGTEEKDLQKVMRRLFFLGYEPDVVFRVKRALRQNSLQEEYDEDMHPL